jgi:hypothetical protein
MAENEIVKHIEAAYKAAKHPNTHWLHKLKEILVEILIIVFAVTISIWFHNWSDSLHERREEKEFLRGLKTDLQADIGAATGDSTFYTTQLQRLSYLQRVGAGENPNTDTLKASMLNILNNTNLEPHISRYEGLKGSGKFGLIENADLLNNIINLHEQTIKHIETLDGYYTDYTNRMGVFIQEHGQLDPNTNKLMSIEQLVRMPQMRFFLMYGVSFISANILKSEDSCIVQCNRLIRQIDTELQ